MPKPTEAQFEQTADVSELLGEELVRRGERMLELGRRLLQQSGDLNAVASGMAIAEAPPEEDRSVGKAGVIGFYDSIRIASKLGTFTLPEFQEATGLKRVAANKWLVRMVNNNPPIIERVVQGTRGRASLYHYIPIDASSDPKSRPEYARQVEASAGVGVDSMATGAAVKYSGRPVGRSGKPGRDRRISRQRKVVDKKK